MEPCRYYAVQTDYVQLDPAGRRALADDYPGLFTMSSAGNVLISGGDYKIEGSIIVLVLNILFGLFFLLWSGKIHKAD